MLLSFSCTLHAQEDFIANVYIKDCQKQSSWNWLYVFCNSMFTNIIMSFIIVHGVYQFCEKFNANIILPLSSCLICKGRQNCNVLYDNVNNNVRQTQQCNKIYDTTISLFFCASRGFCYNVSMYGVLVLLNVCQM